MQRVRPVARGLAALAALAVGLVGIPVALVLLGGNPMPSSISWPAVRHALFTPDDGTILIDLITIVGWIAWLVFAVSVVAELVELASFQRIRIRLPGLAGPQRIAAGLFVAVIAMVTTTQLVPEDPPPVAAVPAAADPVVPSGPVDSASGETSTHLAGAAAIRLARARTSGSLPPVAATHGDDPGHVHIVRRGDDLWSLAEDYYGNGRDWRRIAMANPSVLTGGPDRLEVGWRLRIPGVEDAVSDPDVVVKKGDTLSSVARDVYGHESEWRRLWHANRAQLEDPDELVAGMQLLVPDKTARTSGDRDHRAKPPERRDQRTGEPEETASASPSATVQPTGGGKPTDASPPTAEQQPTVGSDQTEKPQPTTRAAEPTDEPQPTGAAQPSAGGKPSVDVPPDSRDPYEGVVLGLGAVGSLLAAAVIAGLGLRRRTQLQARPLGRRIVPVPEPAGRAESVLGRKQRPFNLRALDLATRGISAYCHRGQLPLPGLQVATVSDDLIEFVMSGPVPEPPPGFTAVGGRWRLDRARLGEVQAIPGIAEAVRPYPALVSLGRDDEGRQLLADLEGIGLLALAGDRPNPAAVIAALAVELAFSPCVDELVLTLVGGLDELPEALRKHNVTRTDDLDGLLDRLERRARTQRAHLPTTTVGQHRIDPDLADPWVPEIVLITGEPTDDQQQRLVDVLTGTPRATMAAVVAGEVSGAPWTLRLDQPSHTEALRGTLEPIGLGLHPQLIDKVAQRAVVELVAATGSDETTPAPWWHGGVEPPDPPPDNVTYLGKRFGGWGSGDGEDPMTQIGVADAGGAGAQSHPILQLLGPIELLGATGAVPPRAGKQCLEYCAWLLQHPGTTAMAMASALAVAEGTRRSNMSRLRTWLGADPGAEPYLPDAYTGRIVLHPAVSSDWQRLQIITAPGVNRSTNAALKAALELVRGAPLADAAPGQWHWAEELRTDMISAVRDIGVELASRAIDAGDLDLARWAAARALVAAPGDELLMSARIRTEHLAGNVAETERLTLQVAAQARALGVDLDPETVVLLQEVMEGRVRARLA
jgi:nucleoid-associated protein YgaU